MNITRDALVSGGFRAGVIVLGIAALWVAYSGEVTVPKGKITGGSAYQDPPTPMRGSNRGVGAEFMQGAYNEIGSNAQKSWMMMIYSGSDLKDGRVVFTNDPHALATYRHSMTFNDGSMVSHDVVMFKNGDRQLVERSIRKKGGKAVEHIIWQRGDDIFIDGYKLPEKYRETVTKEYLVSFRYADLMSAFYMEAVKAVRAAQIEGRPLPQGAIHLMVQRAMSGKQTEPSLSAFLMPIFDKWADAALKKRLKQMKQLEHKNRLNQEQQQQEEEDDSVMLAGQYSNRARGRKVVSVNRWRNLKRKTL